MIMSFRASAVLVRYVYEHLKLLTENERRNNIFSIYGQVYKNDEKGSQKREMLTAARR